MTTTPSKSRTLSIDDLERATVTPSGAKKGGGGGRCGACFRRILTFLFSTVGLTFLTVGYSALGGYIFMVLESPVRQNLILSQPETVTVLQFVEVEPVVNRKKIDEGSLERHLGLLWNLTEEMNVLMREEWIRMAKGILERYTDELYASRPETNETLVSNAMPQIKDPMDDQWTYPGALLYAITVITTIGYGHITPKTTEGMIVTMIYAVIGLPLTFLTIAHLGRIMATTVRFLYHNICCCFLCRSSRSCCAGATKRPTQDLILTREATPCVDGGGGSSKPEGEDGANAAAPEEPTKPPLKKKRLAEVQVPITVTVMILVGYISIGALLFSLWEGWSPVESFYFCFITLSTIGFGDYVPGMSIDEGRSQEKLLSCAVYLLLGLSFLAMCFDLIQQEVLHKCRRLGACIGLVEPDDKH